MKKDKKYVDVTKEWLKEATPNSHEILFDRQFIDNFNIIHPIDGLEKVHYACVDSDEYKVALLLKKTFGGIIHLVPRITDISNTGLSTPTHDYIWNNEKWDLKTPQYIGNLKNSLERFLKRKHTKKQAKNIIVDYSNYINNTNKEIINVVKNTINNRNWIENIIILKNNKIIRIYTKR